MMNKNGNLKAFTIIELMVSIFITMIVIASFFKLYDISAKAERSSSIRVSVNLLGEQILDTIADSVRFIGLNSKVSDLDGYVTGVNTAETVIRTAGQSTFKYLSPYGGPITKLAQDAEGTSYPNCKFTIYNSAAITNNINSFYLHTQDGVFETARQDEGAGYNINYGDYTADFTVSDFESEAKSGLDGTPCKDVFPAGTLISGTDRLFSLKYNNGSLVLYSEDKTHVATDEAAPSANTDIPTGAQVFVNFNKNLTGQSYEMQHFLLQYLTETKDSSGGFVREWKTSAQSFRKDIIAVRFGFFIISTKDRNKGKYSGSDKNTYCVFGDGNINDCEELSDPNKTVYVFRRVVYLSNHRLMRDTQKNN